MNYWPVTIYTLIVGLAWFVAPHPVIIVAAGFVPIGMILVAKNPYVVCLGFIIFSFFRIHEAFRFLIPLHIPLLLALASLGVLGWHLFITREIKYFWTPQLSRFAAFFGLVTIGLIFASNRPAAMSAYTSTYIKIAIMAIAISWLSRTPQDFLLACRLFVLAGISVAIVALLNKMNGIGLVEGTRVTIGRDIGSILGDPNDLSLVLLFPMGFAMTLVFAQGLSKFERLLALIFFFTLASAIIATQSRGGLLGIMAISGFFAWHKVKNKMILVVGASVLLPILLVAAGISDRSSGGAGEEGVDASSMGRIYAWGAAIKMATTNPLTGVGLDNFFINYYYFSSHWDGLNHAVHSTWFGVLAETGFLGFFVFITLLVNLLSNIQKSKVRVIAMGKLTRAGKLNDENGEPIMHHIIEPYVYAIFSGLVSFMVSGTFLTQGFTWPFYILMALSVSAIRYVEGLCAKANAAGHKIA